MEETTVGAGEKSFGKIEAPPIQHEKGEATTINYLSSDEEKEAVVEKVIAQARVALKKGEVFEVRTMLPPSEEYIRSPYRKKDFPVEEQCKKWGIAWYWATPRDPDDRPPHHSLPQTPLFRTTVKEAQKFKELGCIIVARIKC